MSKCQFPKLYVPTIQAILVENSFVILVISFSYAGGTSISMVSDEGVTAVREGPGNTAEG